MRRRAIAIAALVAAVALVPALARGSSAAGQMIAITAVSVDASRHVTVDWSGPPNGIEFGSVQIATKPDVGTDGDFFDENVVQYETLVKGQQHWVGGTALDRPGTYYVRVTGWWDGYSPDDYVNYGVVYSQVTAFDAAPICQEVLVTPAYWKKKLVRKGRWVKRNGKRVWAKPVYKRVRVPAKYRTDCH